VYCSPVSAGRWMREPARAGSVGRRFDIDARALALWLVVALLASACGLSPWLVPPGGGSGLSGEIPGGAGWSLTGPGAAFGPQQQNAAALAVQGINGTEFLGNATIRLVVEDDRSAPLEAVTAFQNLIDRDHVVAILGPTLSTSARRADLIAQARGIPV